MDRREKAPSKQLVKREAEPIRTEIAESLGSVAPALIKRVGAEARSINKCPISDVG